MTEKKTTLGKEGTKLVASVTADMQEHGLVPDSKDDALLLQAGRLVDRIASLEKAVSDEGEFVVSNTGVVRMHPAIPEIRSTVVALATVLSKIALSDDSRPKDKKAQAAANARWGRYHA